MPTILEEIKEFQMDIWEYDKYGDIVPLEDPQQTTYGYDDETGDALATVMDGWEYLSYKQIRHMLYYSYVYNVKF